MSTSRGRDCPPVGITQQRRGTNVLVGIAAGAFADIVRVSVAASGEPCCAHVAVKTSVTNGCLWES